MIRHRPVVARARREGDFPGLLLSNQTHRSSTDGQARLARSLPGAHQKTLGAEKGYDTRDLVADPRISGITPHVAQNIQTRRRSAMDGRTVRHSGYGESINARKRIEQAFCWIKQAAGLRQLKARGRSRVGAVFRLHVVVYNLIGLANLLSPREVLA